MSDIERNKQIVVDYYQTAFAGNPEKAVTDHADPEYKQHNPVVQDGPDGVIGLVTSLRGQYPSLRLDIKRVIAEGDIVVTHSHLNLEPDNPDNPGLALADYFQVNQAGKVVEHWDVIQEIPKTAANDNGMF
jgi:predicted SnoaL-like aldol condensation-catalyzing enzyme